MLKKLGIALSLVFVANVAFAQLSAGPGVVNLQKVETKPGTQVGVQGGEEATASVDIGGLRTGGDAPLDNEIVILDLGTGMDVPVIGIGFDVGIEAFDPSWLSEATIDVNGAVLVTPGVGDDFPGVGAYSSGGIIDLVGLGLEFTATGGIITMELFESFDDGAVAPDGFWLTPSTLTFEFVPEPASLTLLSILGVALMGLRRRL